MAQTKKTGNPIPVDATRHQDKRKNIPTEELRDFVAADEAKPKTLLYPRDPSLDPQLVWKGKDEQDRQPLEVPSVPVYIQEKIHPKAIIENVRAQAKKGKPEAQLTLFADFNGLEFQELIEFYQHEQNWTNRMILGDCLFVMTSLAEKEGLKDRVQMIYIDPPYGIKFGSNWQVSTRKREVKDGKAEDLTRQPEQIRAFRDTWKLGIHSYLSYLRDRLAVARELLTETGSIFVQISDANVHLVRCVMDEVFGSENFCSIITFAKTGGQAGFPLTSHHDYIIWYAKNREEMKYRPIYAPKGNEEAGSGGYDWVEEASGKRRRISAMESGDPTSIAENDKLFALGPLYSEGETTAGSIAFDFEGRVFTPPGGRHWKTTIEGLGRLGLACRLWAPGSDLRYVRYVADFPRSVLSSVWDDTSVGGYREARIAVVQTATKVVQRCVLMTTDPGDLVLDPTCGGGTTAYVAEQWGRRWITIDTSRVMLALARTRLMSARYPYYLLADSPEGVKKEAEVTGLTPPGYKTEGDIRKGFVYKRVPHVTLKSIANNPDIKEGMTREEIDTAIARHAETELLYDRPYEDKKVVRVTGPFTVESLSPHRVLVTGLEDEEAASQAIGTDAGRFVGRILEELRATGVQNTYKGERLVFDALDPFAGVYVQATGTFQENGKQMTAAIAIGPEYGTVGKEMVRDAAKEAVEFADILIVCGFAFEALVEEESKVGRLRILKAKMSPELLMHGVLKKTGAGNLFMVFGEPDISVSSSDADGMLTVEIRGLDVYDPTTAEVRSGGTDDIACWFVDTDYNGEAFFVRHAYFLGADDPYDKLKRALKADIDEGAWRSLYSMTSHPFPKPSTGKIAVKVINHYGDEILKVYEVGGQSA